MTLSKILSTFLIVIILASCANMKFQQAQRYSDAMGYAEAIKRLEKLVQKNPDAKNMTLLAECYQKNSNTELAEVWFRKIREANALDNQHQLQFAIVLMQNGKCAEAETILKEYLIKNPADKKAEVVLQSCESIAKLKEDSAYVIVERIKISSSGSDFGPAFYRDGLVFSTEREIKSKKSEWTGRPYLDLYFSKKDDENKWSEPAKLEGVINSRFHEGPLTFTSDGKEVYFTRNILSSRGLKADNSGTVNLNIYKSSLVKGEWKNIESLNFNQENYSFGHPAITKDGKTMIFVSDIPGGLGQTDLYITHLENGKWSEPKNLGSEINTEGREMFPNLLNDTLLYFSTDGRIGMGGLDIFSSKMDNLNFSEPKNLGYPINSTKDDFGLIADTDGKMGYFSSNRDMKEGIDRIYRYINKGMILTLAGLVVDKITRQPVPFAAIEVTNNDTRTSQTLEADEKGKFYIPIDPYSNYTVTAKGPSYLADTKNLGAKGKTASDTVNVTLELEKVIFNQPIVLKNILYDFDKWNIRPDAEKELNRLITFLKDNENVVIELSSHTDSRGTYKYNEVLSGRRAESAVQFIISKGIDGKRLKWKGYGETKLVNKCADDIACSEIEHQKNRRTEFKVIGDIKDQVKK